MNRFAFLLLFILPFSGLAQNYQLIDTGRVTHFASRNDTKSIRLDSIYTGVNENVLINYKVVDPYAGSCIPIHSDGWLGKKVIIRNNGDHVFINALGDSVLIRSSASLIDVWPMYHDTGGWHVEATLTSKALMNFLGLQDSVKTATLLCKDSAGNIVPNILNNKTISWSRQFGLLNTLSFLQFPLDTTRYWLSGISNPAAGVQNIDARDIFDFAVGDTLQYSVFAPMSQQEWEEFRILSRNSYQDSVVYTAGHTRRIQYLGTSPPPSLTIRDTVTWRFSWNPLRDFSKLSMEFATNDSVMITNGWVYIPYANGYFERIDSSLFNGRIAKRLHPYFLYDSATQCLVMTFRPASWCIYQHYDYAEGLGLVEIYEDWSCYSRSMVYYHKGSEQWGTPFNWGIILGLPDPGRTDVSVFPNPFDDKLEAVAEPYREIESLELYDASGRLVVSAIPGSDHGKLDTGSLSPGFYLLRVSVQGTTLHYKVVRR